MKSSVVRSRVSSSRALKGLPLDGGEGSAHRLPGRQRPRGPADGGSHAVDSSDIAFQEAARGAGARSTKKPSRRFLSRS